MLKKTILFSLLLIVVVWNSSFSQSIIYKSPVPDSRYHNRETNIIIGFSVPLNAQQKSLFSINANGSISGHHPGTTYFVENDTKILFYPSSPFEFGDTVTVTVLPDSLEYVFYVRNELIEPPIHSRLISSEIPINYRTFSEKPESYSPLPDLPALEIIQNTLTAPGYVFLTNFGITTGVISYLMVLENNGTPYFTKQLVYSTFDFKKQLNGLLTYYEEFNHHYKAINKFGVVVDSFYCGNGYSTDFHECQLTEDGGAWLMNYDVETIDMSQIVPGGYTNAQVTGLVIQKINAQKRVTFQWRSWDHIPITDARHINLNSSVIDAVHGNAIEEDFDKNIMISSRHLDEITKINTKTGEIIWRLGGKQNQFTIINDTTWFSYQHDIRRIENGNITLYDNGNFNTPQESRILEYKLDETQKKATLVWEYRHDPPIYAFAMGSAQRLPNGNTFISWGASTTTVTEVTPEGEIVYEMKLPEGQWSYRAFRFEWSLTPTGIGKNEIPETFALEQNYPNPFNQSSIINFKCSVSGIVSIVVYDLLGREVKTLINEYKQPGTYQINFNAEGISSGTYFYRMTAGNFSQIKKMILIK